MYQENAMKLLNQYNYNFDLAKFHILHPHVMADPISKEKIVDISRTSPADLSKVVSDAVIDLQGCKEDEVEQILNTFRADLKKRINDDQLKYHLTILEKIRIPTPPDIEDEIKKSIEFSKEIKRKVYI